MTCAHCTQLEEENAYLRSELGLVSDAQLQSKLQGMFGLRRSAAKLLEALYRAKGRVVDKRRLVEMIGSTDECGKTIDVLVCQLRRAIGTEAVETIHHQGIRIGPAGVAAMRLAA